MDDQEKLAILGPKDTRRRQTTKNTTQYVFDTIIHKQTQIT